MAGESKEDEAAADTGRDRDGHTQGGGQHRAVHHQLTTPVLQDHHATLVPRGPRNSARVTGADLRPVLQVSPDSNLGSDTTLQAPDTAATAAHTMSFAHSALTLPHTAVSGTFSVESSPSMLVLATTFSYFYSQNFIFIYFIIYFYFYLYRICLQTKTTYENMLEDLVLTSSYSSLENILGQPEVPKGLTYTF